MFLPSVLALALVLALLWSPLDAFSTSNAFIVGAILRPILRTCILAGSVDGHSKDRPQPHCEDEQTTVGSPWQQTQHQESLSQSNSELKTTNGNQVAGLSNFSGNSMYKLLSTVHPLSWRQDCQGSNAKFTLPNITGNAFGQPYVDSHIRCRSLNRPMHYSTKFVWGAASMRSV